jgi:hypothetical protein
MSKWDRLLAQPDQVFGFQNRKKSAETLFGLADSYILAFRPTCW